MAGGVGVDLEPGPGVERAGGLQHGGAERQHLGVGSVDVVDVEVEVDLLRRAVGPVGRLVIRGELDGDAGRPVDGVTAMGEDQDIWHPRRWREFARSIGATIR